MLAGTANANPDHVARHLPGASPGVTYDAVVTVDGVLLRGDGATSAQRLGRGQYSVGFDADLSTCVIVATSGRATTGGGWYEKPSFMATSLTSDDTGLVIVNTGGVLGHPRKRSFHLLVSC
jgi:hypothetical protein